MADSMEVQAQKIIETQTKEIDLFMDGLSKSLDSKEHLIGTNAATTAASLAGKDATSGAVALVMDDAINDNITMASTATQLVKGLNNLTNKVGSTQ